MTDYNWVLARAREVLKNIQTDIVVNGRGFEIALVITVDTHKHVTIVLRTSKNGKEVTDVSQLNPEVRQQWLDMQLAQVSKMIEE